MGVRPSVGIIGAGAGGIAMGIQLADGGGGTGDFTIFDRGDGFGGTWRHNTFPGAACDVPSHLYSFSFALNPRWSKTYANQPEILEYLEKVAADRGLHAHLRANTVIETVRWSDRDRRWTLTTDGGAVHHFDVVVSAVGMLDVPNIPSIPGAERFGGRAFHSSRWDHSRSTAGERVASIGTGASAIQYVPAIARETAHLTVFQRTPIWVSPRHDVPFTAEQQELFERDRGAALALREEIFNSYETSSFDVDATQTREATELAYSYLMRKVSDPELRGKLTPDYPVGCKRPLMSRDWFPTFALPHVHLETSPIVGFTERGLRTADGVEHRVDTVIYGTGFRAADYLSSIDVYGTGGRRLHDEWAGGRGGLPGHAYQRLPEFLRPLRAQHQRRQLDPLHPRGADGVHPPHPRRGGRARERAPSRSRARRRTGTTPASRPRWRARCGSPTATVTTATPAARSSLNCLIAARHSLSEPER